MADDSSEGTGFFESLWDDVKSVGNAVAVGFSGALSAATGKGGSLNQAATAVGTKLGENTAGIITGKPVAQPTNSNNTMLILAAVVVAVLVLRK